MNRRRLIEVAFLLPWLGAFLLMPPVVLIVQSWARATGFPLFIVYIFVCWIMLIVLGALLSIRLARLGDATPEDGSIIRHDDESG